MSLSFNYNWGYYPLTSYEPITPSDSVSGNISITIYPVWFHQVSLQWSIPADWGACTFNVYKSGNQTGPFEKLTHTPIDATFLKDVTTQANSKFNTDWYVVEAMTTTGKRIRSAPKTWENIRAPFVEIRASEVQRREWLLLRKFTGVKTYVFKRRTYGKRCPNCWSFELEKIVKDHCKICMGTSFEGGYFPAFETLFQYDQNQDRLSLSYFGKFEPNEISAWTIAYPELTSRDLVYRVPDGSIYYIDDKTPTTLQTVTVRQILKLVQLDQQAPEFQAVMDNNLIPQQFQVS
jgi:hypothetical protein